MNLEYKNLQIELTNACNLSCVECPHRVMQRTVCNMSDDVFTKILNEFIVGKNIFGVILSKDGEPLINNRLTSYINRISDVNQTVKIDLYTNGLFLNKQFLVNLASKPNMSRVMITFHFYDACGQKNDYQPLTDLLLEVLQIPMPKISFSLITHITKFVSTQELDDWKKFWTQVKLANKFDAIIVNPHINPWNGKVPEGNTWNDVCAYGHGMDLFIGNTGNVLACCADLDEEIIFGNIMTEPLIKL